MRAFYVFVCGISVYVANNISWQWINNAYHGRSRALLVGTLARP